MRKQNLDLNVVNNNAKQNLSILKSTLPLIRKAIIATVMVGALMSFAQKSFADNIPQSGSNLNQTQSQATVVKDKAYYSKFALLTQDNINQVSNLMNKQIIVEDKKNDRIEKFSINRNLNNQMHVAENISSQRILDDISNLQHSSEVLMEYNSDGDQLSAVKIGDNRWELDRVNGLGYTHTVNGQVVGQETASEVLNQANNILSSNANKIIEKIQSLEVKDGTLIASAKKTRTIKSTDLEMG